jgi:cystathionine beta-lyase
MAEALELFGKGASWGGYESLALPSTGFLSRSAGTGEFGGQLMRLHIGLEAVEDLEADLAQGLAVMNARR